VYGSNKKTLNTRIKSIIGLFCYIMSALCEAGASTRTNPEKGKSMSLKDALLISTAIEAFVKLTARVHGVARDAQLFLIYEEETTDYVLFSNDKKCRYRPAFKFISHVLGHVETEDGTRWTDKGMESARIPLNEASNFEPRAVPSSFAMKLVTQHQNKTQEQILKVLIMTAPMRALFATPPSGTKYVKSVPTYLQGMPLPDTESTGGGAAGR